LGLHFVLVAAATIAVGQQLWPLLSAVQVSPPIHNDGRRNTIAVFIQIS